MTVISPAHDITGLSRHNSWLTLSLLMGNRAARDQLNISLPALIFSVVGPLVWFPMGFVFPIVARSFLVGLDVDLSASMPVMIAKQFIIQAIMLLASYLLVYAISPARRNVSELRAYVITANYMYLWQSMLLPIAMFFASLAGVGFWAMAIMATLSIALINLEWRQIKYVFNIGNGDTWRIFLLVKLVQIVLAMTLSANS